jgi:hypothetical protein
MGKNKNPKCVDPRGEPSIGAAARKAPLVIVWHDHDNSKEDHAFQAMHLASWGMHGLALDLPRPRPMDRQWQNACQTHRRYSSDAAARRGDANWSHSVVQTCLAISKRKDQGHGRTTNAPQWAAALIDKW